jgi:hypothetical protein
MSRLFEDTIRVIGIPVLALALVGLILLREARTDAQMSCVASIAQSVQDQVNQLPPTPIDEQWRILSDEERTSLLTQVGGADCSGSNPIVDRWGNEYHIAIRRRKSSPEIRLWSSGPDGHSGNEDDIVAPSGERSIVQ